MKHSGEIYRLCKEQYEREFARRTELTNALALPLGVITLIGGGAITAIWEISMPLQTLELAALALFAITFFFLTRAAVFFWKSYHNYEYRYIATAGEILKWRTETEAYYKRSGVLDSAENADKELAAFLTERRAAAADHNARLNNTKSGLIFRANEFLLWSIFTGAVFAVTVFLARLLIFP